MELPQCLWRVRGTITLLPPSEAAARVWGKFPDEEVAHGSSACTVTRRNSTFSRDIPEDKRFGSVPPPCQFPFEVNARTVAARGIIVSHEPCGDRLRRRRDRIMKRFKSPRHSQRLVSIHDAVANLLNIPGHTRPPRRVDGA